MASTIGDNMASSTMDLERMLCMKAGNGEASYLHNSLAQAQHAKLALHFLTETLDGMDLIRSGGDHDLRFVVEDLGCSCGGNTIYIVEVIINHMTNRFQAAGLQVPEFTAFFSDLPSNDFNTLFQLLPPYANSDSMEECLAFVGRRRSYFASAVPGSFYRRLFLAKSVDVFYSAFSLHWLSKVPEVVMDTKSGAYNKGRIFIHGANKSTANAYKKQFQADLSAFLHSRSQEIRPGGSVFLVCLARTRPTRAALVFSSV